MIDRRHIAHLAEELRADFGKDNLTPLDVFALARSIPHLTTVLFPFGENISGMCVIQDRFSVIAVNSGQTYGRQRFTLAHELYHLFFDSEKKTAICPADAASFDESERSADMFASYFLLPYYALRNELKAFEEACLAEGRAYERLLSWVLSVEQKYGVSRLALLVRLFDEGAISMHEKEALSKNIIKNARRLGFSLALYEPRRGDDAKKAEGEYVDLIFSLFNEGAISQGKAEELLSDGFRNDIWITSIETGEIID